MADEEELAPAPAVVPAGPSQANLQSSASKSNLSQQSSRRNAKAMLKPLKEAAQEEYEKCLLDEIMKLQDTLVIQQALLNEERQEAEQKALNERRARTAAGEKASRLAMLEAAANNAQAEEARQLAKPREAADARLAQREQEAQRERAVAARKKEEQRLLAVSNAAMLPPSRHASTMCDTVPPHPPKITSPHAARRLHPTSACPRHHLLCRRTCPQAEMHKETMSRFAEEMRQQEAARQEKNVTKEAALHARFEEERREIAARNAKKADDAAAKIDRAFNQRQQLSMEQRKVFHERHMAHEARMATIAEAEEQRKRELKRRAAEKRECIEKAQQQQQARMEERRQAILHKEAQKQAELDRKAVEIDVARYEKQQQRLLLHAASRGRVDHRMEELKAKMSHLNQTIEERYAKVEEFERQKELHLRSAQDIAVRMGLEKQSMHDSMRRMRQQATKARTAERLDVPAHIRANIKNEQLRSLLDHMDAKGEGHISLRAMRDVLTQEPSFDQSKSKRKGHEHSASAPALTTAKPKLTKSEQLIQAFKEADKDLCI